MKRLTLIFTLVLAVAAALTLHRADAEVQDIQSLKGTVEAVISDELFAVKLIDQDMMHIVNFNTDEATTYENISSVEDLSEGDVVTVEFSKIENLNIAQRVIKIGSIQVQGGTENI